MVLAGIDIGKSKVAVAIFEGNIMLDVAHLELDPQLNRASNLHELATWTKHQVHSVPVLYVEEPLVGRNTRVSLEIAQTVGAVLAACYTKHVALVSVTAWKAMVVGKGNASKIEVKTWLRQQHPGYEVLCNNNQDRVDAICIGFYGVKVEQIAHKLAREYMEDLR